MNYYERHIGDYLKDTAHLSLLEHGVYARLLDVYYTREQPFAPGEAVRLVGARSKEERAAVESVLAEFFVDGRQPRCDREIERYRVRVEHNQRVGKLGGRPKKPETQTEPEQNPPGYLREPEPNPPSLQTPDTRPKRRGDTPLKPPAWSPPEWVPAEPWANFVQHRKAMRSVPFTDAARDGVVAELRKLADAGHDPAELLATAVTRGWRTVFPPRANGSHVGAVDKPSGGKHAGFDTKDYTAGVTSDGFIA